MSKLPYRGYLRSVWNYFTKVRPAKKSVRNEVVGTDLAGNQYVLRSADPSAGIKDARIILPSEKTMMSYTEKYNMNIPQEWEEWLRYRRDDPPTVEELEMNKLKKLKMQQRVRELEKRERLERGEDVSELDTDTKTDQTNLTENISGDTTKSHFPVYDDLEKVAGETKHRPKENT